MGGASTASQGVSVSVVYELCDVSVGDGGFGCIPKNHDFAFNDNVLGMDKGWNSNWADSPWTSKMDSWPADIPLHRVADKVDGLQAGDCILFSGG